MEQLQAKQILQSRVVIAVAGKYTVKCTSANPFIREDGTAVTIVNFNAMTPFQASKAKEAYRSGDFDAAVGKGTSLSTSQLSGQYVPSKGEIIDIEVSDYHSEKVDADILVVSSIVPRKATKAAAFNLDDLDAPAEPATVAEADLVDSSN